MKVKLYKGPLHNKTMDISDYVLNMGRVSLTVKDPKSKGQRFTNDDGSRLTHIYDGYRLVEYEVKIVSCTIAGRTYYGPSLHPDGTLILTYVEGKK